MKHLFEHRMLMGRLASGFESDHGKLVHATIPGQAITYGGGTALCGAKPGSRGCGWSQPEDKPVTCKKCIHKSAQPQFRKYWNLKESEK